MRSRLQRRLLTPPPSPLSAALLVLLLLLLTTTSPGFAANASGDPGTYTVEGKIVPNDEMPEIPQTMHVTLNGGLYAGYVGMDGNFAIHSVSPGSYLLEVLTGNYSFDRYRVDVGEPDATASVKAYLVPVAVEWDIKGPTAAYPLRITAQRRNKFFQDREGFNIVGMFANPMMLMMLLSVGLMFLGPKLMENMDPQALEEVKRTSAGTTPQAALPDLSQTLANMFSPKPPSSSPSSGSSSSAGKPRRR